MLKIGLSCTIVNEFVFPESSVIQCALNDMLKNLLAVILTVSFII